MLPPGFEELEIPRSAMQRKIKHAADGKAVQKDAKTAISRATVLFISYLTSAARDVAGTGRAASMGTPTITQAHVFDALQSAGFGPEFVEAVRARVDEHRAATAERARRRAESAAADDTGVSSTGDDSEDVSEDDERGNSASFNPLPPIDSTRSSMVMDLDD